MWGGAGGGLHISAARALRVESRHKCALALSVHIETADLAAHTLVNHAPQKLAARRAPCRTLIAVQNKLVSAGHARRNDFIDFTALAAVAMIPFFWGGWFFPRGSIK